MERRMLIGGLIIFALSFGAGLLFSKLIEPSEDDEYDPYA
jgi:hypothetical protein